MESEAAQRLVAQALARDEGAIASLVDRLTPVIQARVARSLLSVGPGRADIRTQVEDLTQEIFLLLFADGGKVLADWQPARGLSLENFVGLVATRRTLSVLRTKKRGLEATSPPLPDDHEMAAADRGPEERTASRQQLRLLLSRLREELSPLGWHLFDLLFVQERSVEAVGAETDLSRDAIYAWRSRLRRRARHFFDELMSDRVAPGRNNRQDEGVWEKTSS